MNTPNTFHKKERITSQLLIDQLFNKESSHSMTAFPLRVVYRLIDLDEPTDAPVQILISVPKRCFHRAVKRNRVKRQIREAYRKNKHSLLDTIATNPCQRLLLAFIWLDQKLYTTSDVESKTCRLLARLAEKALPQQKQNEQ